MSKQARVGTGQFQWNIGAWVGSVLGGTLWMFGIGVSAFYFGHAIVSATILCCATMAVVACVLLWINRHRINPHPALQIMIGILACCTLIIFLLLDLADIPFAYRFGEQQSAEAGFSYYWCLLMFPALLFLFHMKERGGQK
jgi:hypothetical protein